MESELVDDLIPKEGDLLTDESTDDGSTTDELR